MGTPLFDRSLGRDFRRTPAGEVLVDYAKRLISLRDEALAAVEEIRNLKSGQLRIGTNQSIGEYLLPQLTKIFLERYPGVKLKVVIGYSDAVLTALKHHELDLALVATQLRDNDVRGADAHARQVGCSCESWPPLCEQGCDSNPGTWHGAPDCSRRVI